MSRSATHCDTATRWHCRHVAKMERIEGQVNDGDTILVDHSDGRTFFVKVESGKRVNIGKTSCKMSYLLNAPYGAVFELDGNRLVRVDGELVEAEEEPPGVVEEVTAAALASDVRPQDNRGFTDTNTAQKLTEEDIHKMKNEGKGGRAIIQALMDNSDTWGNKTQYSQAKWLKRKQQKYRPRVRVVRVTGRTMCDAYFAKNREKVSNLRSDALALVLTHANVFAGCQALVLDTCMGVVTAAMLERMGCQGRIFALYAQSQPSMDAVRKFDHAEKNLLKCLLPLHTSELGRLSIPESEREADPVDDGGPGDSRTEEEALAEYRTVMDDHGVPEKDRPARIERKLARMRRNKHRPAPRQVRDWLRQGCDCLVIACKFDPIAAVDAMLPHLTPSRPFAIYSEFIEVLPGRTHPLNNMSSCGGYVLTGIKITNNRDPRGVIPKARIPDMAKRHKKKRYKRT
ncbi:conserved unknown protein [Ectocarpus siliculosus]|uniref:tRNA (adenine(58)-N(1))-methyltransferase non-catalytic subunit TRM6 n=1 Tax=Ectocarpus siliculosus TaxID=2880 RepID=D8LS75_ECTSI|nr:conserved unknown protein [Ectocarpus siliculosus]|eukprot:CBN75132.1 conserved unknown protein [Ectocarpus siliculosus]